MDEVRLLCETTAKNILPIFRSYLAKDLVEKYGFSQSEAAKKIGTTQAAVSQYIHLKRGHRGVDEFKDFLPKIQSVASEAGRLVATQGMDSDGVTIHLCRLCTSLQESKLSKCIGSRVSKLGARRKPFRSSTSPTHHP